MSLEKKNHKIHKIGISQIHTSKFNRKKIKWGNKKQNSLM